ncbi:Signal-transduction histidine kinase senX3 [Thalassocella blandensis]|nr:Signal-transduction histidine kinase senX3 [Thalassocella blandensis]
MHSYPHFVDDVSFYQMDNDKSRLEQQEAMLKNLKSVFNIANQTYKDLQLIVRDCLRAGIEIFGMETGIVSRIEGHDYTVMDVVSNSDTIKKGDVFPLVGTYCHEVFQSGSVLGFPHVGALEFMLDHPVYVNLKLEAYLSSPIEVDGALYGTLNFTSSSEREFGFSEHERDLIRLMANAIGNFISLRERDDKLQAMNNQLKKFIGFVAHDLRNPLGAMQSMAKMGLRPNAPAERIPKLFERINVSATLALEFVHNILELAALGTGKIKPNIQLVKLNEILQATLHQIEDLCQSSENTVQIDVPDGLEVAVDKGMFIQIFANLLTNAIKYSPAGEGVLVKSEEHAQGKMISVVNKIDVDVPEVDIYSDIYRSFGFGLDIVSEILDAHHSSLNLSDSENIFTASFILPQ